MGPDDYVKEVMTTMKRFREQNILCDTILVTDDREILAHSVILAAVSPLLCSTFTGLRCTEANKIQYTVGLPGCSASAVELVLQFLYSGQLAMPLIYQQADKFSSVLVVCKLLGIDIKKLNGARVTFESSLESTAAVTVDQRAADACGIPLKAESSSYDRQLLKVDDSLSGCESGVSSFPSADNISMNDIPSIRHNAAHDSNISSSDVPMPLLSVVVPLVSKKPPSNLKKGTAKNATNKILSQRSAAKSATKRNNNKDKPAKGRKQWLSEAAFNALSIEDKNFLLNNNNVSNSIPKNGNREDNTAARSSPSPTRLAFGNSIKERPVKVTSSVQQLTEVTMTAVRSGDKRDLLPRNYSTSIPRGGNREDKTDTKPSPSLTGSALGNGIQERPAKIARTKQKTTEVTLKDTRSENDKDLLLKNNDGFPRSGGREPHTDGKPSPSLSRLALGNGIKERPAKIADVKTFPALTRLALGSIIKERPVKVARSKESLTDVTLKAVRSGEKKDLLLTNNSTCISGSGNREDNTAAKPSPSLARLALGNSVKERSAKVARSKQQSTEVTLKTVRSEDKDLVFTNNIDSSLISGNSEEHTNVEQSSSLVVILKVCEKGSAKKLRVGKATTGRKRKMYSRSTCGKDVLKPRCFRQRIQSPISWGKSRVCDTCGKIFASVCGLRVHQKSHLDGFPHVCEVCGKGYKIKRLLRLHTMTHTGIRPFLCDKCGSGFRNIGVLKRHVLMKHTTIRPFVCGICSKGFATHQHLARHGVIHSGDRKFKCELCDSSFKDIQNLRLHKLRHKGDKPFVCPVCLRAFKQKMTMKIHMRIHDDKRTSYVCQVCDRRLTTISSLQRHVQSHSQQKPHVCKVCGKGFSIKEYLTQHAIIHSDKVYFCETCKKRYRCKRSLLKHSKTHNVIPCGN